MHRATLIPVILLAACVPEMDAPELVYDLRVLALRAEPPEVVLPLSPDDLMGEAADPLTALPDELPPVTLDALVARPGWNGEPLAYRFRACPPNEDYRCGEAEPILELAAGTATTTAAIRAELAVDPALLEASAQANPLSLLTGVKVLVDLRIGEGTDALWAAKEVTFALPVPEGRTANANPQLAAVLQDDRVVDHDLILAPLPELVLTASVTDSSQQEYRVPTYDGGARDMIEHMEFAFYVTEGAVEERLPEGLLTYEKDPADERTTEFTWSGLDYPTQTTLWVVARDNRGGVDWETYRVRVEE